jgi:hypothetical protein
MNERSGSRGGAFWREEFRLMVAWAMSFTGARERVEILSTGKHQPYRFKL